MPTQRNQPRQNTFDISAEPSFRRNNKMPSKSRVPRRHRTSNEELFRNEETSKIYDVWQGFFQMIYDYFLKAFQIIVCAPVIFLFYLDYKLRQPEYKPPVAANKHETRKSTNNGQRLDSK